MHKKTNVLLFDLGGVILDISFDRVFNYWAALSNQQLSNQQLTNQEQSNPHTLKSRFRMDEAYRKHEKGQITAAQYYDSLRQSLGLTLTDKEIETGWNQIFIDMIPGITDLLNNLQKKIPLYCFTNTNNTHRIEWQSRWGKQLQSFEKIFVSSDIGLRKPDKEAFDYVVECIGERHEKILFLDDSLENIEGAQRAGLQTAHVKSLDDTTAVLDYWLAN